MEINVIRNNLLDWANARSYDVEDFLARLKRDYYIIGRSRVEHRTHLNHGGWNSFTYHFELYYTITYHEDFELPKGNLYFDFKDNKFLSQKEYEIKKDESRIYKVNLNYYSLKVDQSFSRDSTLTLYVDIDGHFYGE